MADSVLRQLLQPGNSTAVRHTVMEMIDAAEVEPIFQDLLQVAFDGNAESVLRAKAATRRWLTGFIIVGATYSLFGLAGLNDAEIA